MALKTINYEETILKERKEREERFKNTERGWLGLAGLYWLRDGENRIGSAPTNDIILPPVAPDHIGIVQYNNGVATFRAARHVPVYCNGKQVSLKTLVADIYEEADFLQIGDLTLVLLERADRHLIRVWDRQSKLRKEFTGFKQYPVDPKYRVEAKYTPYDTEKLVSIQDVIEIYHEVPVQGYVTFELDGIEHRLEAMVDEEDYMRLDFKDKTNGDTTYIGGRFLIAKTPKKENFILDFNQAYNPPCAYTDFATCPLPPLENRLPIRIEAGEKAYREVDGHKKS
ncbi:MAG: DUF1684 domain-containing protein [Anaerolineales bacterium]|jgi:uncharacterized protein (DUF1684 family)